MIKVVNKHHGEQGEYIGRGSPLGNPFTHMKGTKARWIVATREEAVARYRDWLRDQLLEKNPAIIAELRRLMELAEKGDLNLKCFCAPKACHGDVIKEFLDAYLERKKK